MSVALVMFSAFSSDDDRTLAAMPTSRSFCSRRWAVTTMSPGAVAEAALSVAGAGMDGAVCAMTGLAPNGTTSVIAAPASI